MATDVMNRPETDGAKADKAKKASSCLTPPIVACTHAGRLPWGQLA